MRLVAISIAASQLLLAACQMPAEPYAPQTHRQYAPPARCKTDFWGNCMRVASQRHAYRWRYVRPGIRSRERFEHAQLCHPRRRVVGDERPSREEAQTAAGHAWMGSIRYDYGERYQDLALAKEVRHTCVPSSPGSTLKSALFRCVAEATPCRAPEGNTR
jgi:hypothetical protein